MVNVKRKRNIIRKRKFNDGKHLEDRNAFADIGATILENFNLKQNEELIGTSIKELLK